MATLPVDIDGLTPPDVLQVEYGLEDEKQFWGGSLVDGLRHGPWIQWDEGQVRTLKVYSLGKVVGPWVKWHASGRMAYHVEGFGPGGMEGRARYWYPDGAAKADRKYEGGKLHGKCRAWTPDGRLDPRESGVFEAGEWLRPLR